MCKGLCKLVADEHGNSPFEVGLDWLLPFATPLPFCCKLRWAKTAMIVLAALLDSADGLVLWALMQ